jgi:catechol 2,3-dioxygenase-like lactoylglutathione lyase family enzyme
VLTTADVIGFLPSADLDRSRRFFGETLGLFVVEVTPFACVVRSGRTMLRVTKVDRLRPQSFTVLGWQVADIRSEVSLLANAGVDVIRYDGLEQDDFGVWATPTGDKVAWFHDPDGNTLSMTQFARTPGQASSL